MMKVVILAIRCMEVRNDTQDDMAEVQGRD